MAESGRVNPECEKWLREAVVTELMKRCRSDRVAMTKKQIKTIAYPLLDKQIKKSTAIWLEANHDDHIEDWENDEEALEEYARDLCVGWFYENTEAGIVDDIYSEMERMRKKDRNNSPST